MKLLIVSDSHGLVEQLQSIIKRHKDEVQKIIHCGDSELDVNEDVLKNVMIVKGNCDWHNQFPNEELIQIGNEKLYITHGHLYNVKMSYVPLSYRAEEVGATIVCFGHSHVATAFMENNIIYINPGSIHYPRKIKAKTYVICEVVDDEVQVHFYDLSGNSLQTLAKKFHRS